MGNEDFKLPSGWHCRSLVDCTKGGNISYGIVQPGQHQDDGIGIIRVNNIQNGKISVADVLKVSHDVESKFSKTRLEGGEVLLTLVGSTGLSAITTKDLHGWNVARAIAVIKPSDEISAEWIHICLQSPYTKYFLDSRANTTVQKTLNLKDVKEIPLPIPPIEERMNLEKIYFDLESKINLNLEINQTLEQMSQTLFKSWFVDFDPVIDNVLDAGNPIPETLQSRAELRQQVRKSADFKPLTADIRTLFPAEFEETELGCVPKGWVTNRLENILELAYGKALKKTERTNGDYPVYGSGGVDGTHNEYLVKGPGIIVGRKGTVGSLHWENKDFYPIDTVFFVKPKEYYSLVYCHQLLKTLGLENMNTDAAVPGLNRNNAYRLEVVTPTQSIITKFTNIIQTIQHKMDSNHNETENLTALRDTLLPKLISGELSLEDLPDLIKQTEAA